MVTKIYLVRHCQTMGNLERIFQGQTDTEPSPDGIIQLDLLSIRFRNVHLDKIYSSTLGRAVKTAEAINKFHNVSHEKLDGFREICVGKMDGMNWDEIPEIYPDKAIAWNENPCEFVSDGGETMRDVYARMSETFENVVKDNPGKTIAVVSHGCALRNLLCYCMNKPIEELNDVDFGVNTAVSLVEAELGSRKIVFSNDASHLPDKWNKKSHRVGFDLTKIKGR
jgi:broad specificity phosphatase PhoE